MTIEEAIEHAEEKEKENKKLSKRYDDASGYSRSGNKDIRTNEAKKCEKCAEEHRQLAEWLKDYKRLLEREPKTGHWIWDNERSDWYDTTFKCSCCGREIIVPYESHTSVYTDYPYCHCGARMSEVSE